MWTICWTDGGKDKWDRQDKAGTIELLRTLHHNKSVSMEDILVFPPDSEADINELLEEAGIPRKVKYTITQQITATISVDAPDEDTARNLAFSEPLDNWEISVRDVRIS